MVSLPSIMRIWLCTKPADMRRGFDSLAELVRQELGEDPLSGHLFVFRNRRGDRIKFFYWDEDGYAIWYKRLEQGVFRFPQPNQGGKTGVMIRSVDLQMLLEGVDWQNVQRGKRYRRPIASST